MMKKLLSLVLAGVFGFSTVFTVGCKPEDTEPVRDPVPETEPNGIEPEHDPAHTDPGVERDPDDPGVQPDPDPGLDPGTDPDAQPGLDDPGTQP